MNINDIWTVSPSIALLVAALIFIAVDIAFRKRYLAAYMALAAMVGAFLLALNLWFGVIGDIPIEGFGGLVSADRFSAFFQILITLIAIAVLVASLGYAAKFGEYKSEFVTLMLLSAVGMLLLASARELITLYVAFELTALPVAAMATIRHTRQAIEAGIKFLILSAVGSALMLFGIVLIYAFTGTTFLTEIGAVLSGSESIPIAAYVSMLLIGGGLAFKMSVAPWQMWVPDVYEGAPAPVAAFLSTASKASAFAAFLTVLYLAFSQLDYAAPFIGVFATISMIYGNLGALRQRDLKRLLGYSTIAQAGYILIGVAAITAAVPETTSEFDGIGIAAVLFYLATYAFTNLAVFFVIIAIVKRAQNSDITVLKNLWKRAPSAAVVLTIGVLSLIGLPPSAGFFAKLAVFGAIAYEGLIWLLIIGVINSFVAAYYYLRILRQVFAAPQDKTPEPTPAEPDTTAPIWKTNKTELLAAAVAAAGVIFFGILSFVLNDWTADAANALLAAISGG